jgi:hypothetical protein
MGLFSSACDQTNSRKFIENHSRRATISRLVLVTHKILDHNGNPGSKPVWSFSSVFYALYFALSV